MSSAATRVREWRDKPGLFVRQQLHGEPDAWQDEVLEAAAAGASGNGNAVNPEAKRRIALKASKGPGKSTLFAWLLWWFLVTRLHPKVVGTSISEDNLRDGLWTEAAKWQARSELLKAAFAWTATRITAVDHPETWWASARNWPKQADATKQADTLAGVHADNVLFLVDEAGGVPDAVIAAAEAGLANVDPRAGREALLAIAGNPTLLSGPLYRACTRERAMWWVKEISGDPDDPKRAPRVSVEWAREQIKKYGRDNPWVLVNVFGQFPPSQSNTLIGVEDAGKAALRELAERDFRDEPKVLGVDVARFGDDRSVLQYRQGRAAFRPRVFRNLDTQELADQVAMSIQKENPDGVFIDVTGVGAGVVDRLVRLKYAVVGVESGSRPFDPRKYRDRRAEMWFSMAEWVHGGGAIPDDAELISELTAPKYFFTADGRLQLESKADLKRQGFASPDKADALALTFAAPVAHRGLVAALDGRAGTIERADDPFGRR